MAHKAVFLDRDDTLINDPGYISDPGQVELLPGTSKALIDIQKMGYKTVVVSNQSAVARGIITEKTLDHIHARLRELLGRQNAYLDAIYYCPFHPEGSVAKYRKESDMRKPNPGMLLQAAQEMNIDLQSSWMVGDSYRDITAGKKAGCKTILINSSAHPAQKKPDDPAPDYKAVNIVEAVNIIKMYDRHKHIPVETTWQNVPTAETPDNQINTTQTLDEMQPPDLDNKFEHPAPKIVEYEQPQIDKIEKIQEDKSSELQASIDQKIQVIKERKKQKVKSSGQSQHTDDSDTLTQVAEEIEAISTYAKSATVDRRKHDTPAEKKSFTDLSAHEKTHMLLDDISTTLKKMHRQAMFTEFSTLRLLAWAMQIVTFGLALLSIVFLLDAEKQMANVYITLAYTVITQLMVIAFCFMSNRK